MKLVGIRHKEKRKIFLKKGRKNKDIFALHNKPVLNGIRIIAEVSVGGLV